MVMMGLMNLVVFFVSTGSTEKKYEECWSGYHSKILCQERKRWEYADTSLYEEQSRVVIGV